MIRIPIFMLAILISTYIGYTAKQPKQAANNADKIEKLKSKRFDLLQSRTDYLKQLVDLKRISSNQLIEPKLDLINAKLEYENEDERRIKLYKELLVQYGLLIEIAKSRADHLLASGNAENTQLKLLHLQSEQIRIQIEIELLK